MSNKITLDNVEPGKVGIFVKKMKILKTSVKSCHFSHFCDKNHIKAPKEWYRHMIKKLRFQFVFVSPFTVPFNNEKSSGIFPKLMIFQYWYSGTMLLRQRLISGEFCIHCS